MHACMHMYAHTCMCACSNIGKYIAQAHVCMTQHGSSTAHASKVCTLVWKQFHNDVSAGLMAIQLFLIYRILNNDRHENPFKELMIEYNSGPVTYGQMHPKR